MRQCMGPKKVARYRRDTGLPLRAILVRGGTEHRKDLCLEDGSIVHLFSDGEMVMADGISCRADRSFSANEKAEVLQLIIAWNEAKFTAD